MSINQSTIPLGEIIEAEFNLHKKLIKTAGYVSTGDTDTTGAQLLDIIYPLLGQPDLVNQLVFDLTHQYKKSSQKELDEIYPTEASPHVDVSYFTSNGVIDEKRLRKHVNEQILELVTKYRANVEEIFDVKIDDLEKLDRVTVYNAKVLFEHNGKGGNAGKHGRIKLKLLGSGKHEGQVAYIQKDNIPKDLRNSEHLDVQMISCQREQGDIGDGSQRMYPSTYVVKVATK